MTTPCLYSIVRYAPYAETEEFANVGVVICAPKDRKFSYMLTNANDARVRAFFRDDVIFSFAKEAVDKELNFACKQIEKLNSSEKIANFFNYLIARKESVIHYSNARVIMTDSPEDALLKLFNKFVNHSEVTKESREQILNRELKRSFSHYKELKDCFKKHTLGGDLTKFTLPFVAKQDNEIKCAIKPLAFVQDKPEKMMEHCDSWTSKIVRASSEGLLDISTVLLTIDGPSKPDYIESKAMKEIRNTFDKHNINHLEHKDERGIIEFARNSI